VNLYEMLDKIEVRPGMYFIRPGFSSLEAFIHGYDLALMFNRVDEREDPPFVHFNSFVIAALGAKADASWQAAIMAAAPDDDAALALFFRLFRQFRGHTPPAQSAVSSA
jgi:hypothetical protein